MTNEQGAVAAVVMAEMDGCEGGPVSLRVELLAEEDITRKVEADLGSDPRERQDEDDRSSHEPCGVTCEARRERRTSDDVQPPPSARARVRHREPERR